VVAYKIDLFAIFIFLGVVQAMFLSIFFLSKESRRVQANVFHGILLLSMAACIFEILLMYTGYIVQCLYLVDFSEPFAFLIGPSLYLMVYSISRGSVSRIQYLHYVVALVYTAFVIPFFLLPEDVKYNCWIESYGLDIPLRPHDYQNGEPRLFWITNHHTLLVIISMAVYAGLSLYEVIRAFNIKKESFFVTTNPVLKDLRAGLFQLGSATVFMLIIKFFNRNDTGDHMLAAYVALVIYIMSFRVIRRSGFFRPATLAEPQKYKGSSVTMEDQKNMLTRLEQLMIDRKPFLNADFSLPDLAQQLGVTVHSLSQTINAGLGKSFFEMTAEYRVEEAKKLLREKSHIKVEEIAEQVGYNSKSSFNNAFKKFTGKTPSEFRLTG
jgi:AraC-like DNA-binding protein